MRRTALVSWLVALAILVPSLASADGWRGGPRGGPYRPYSHRWHPGPRVYFGFGAPYSWGWGPRFGWWWPPPVYVEQRTIVREAPVYVERERDADASDSAPSADARDSQGLPDGTWYFCRSANQYYPDVPHCAEPWIPVPARSQ